MKRVIEGTHDQRRVGLPVVRRYRAGRARRHGRQVQIHSPIVQKWWGDVIQSHHWRPAELRTLGRGYKVRERIVGEIARQIDGVDEPTFAMAGSPSRSSASSSPRCEAFDDSLRYIQTVSKVD
jgi:hypothetical protein